MDDVQRLLARTRHRRECRVTRRSRYRLRNARDVQHARPAQLAVGRQLGERIGGGVVQTPVERPMWLPYVRVEDVGRALERAQLLGARVLLDPREGPAGWRAVVATRAAGEIAFWQPKS